MAKKPPKVPGTRVADLRGTVGVVSGEMSRYAAFSMCLIRLLQYSGHLIGFFDWMTGVNVTGNCNDLARRMKGEWLWLIGDDHVFRPDILERLAAHDVDVVVPLVLQRASPYPHVVYSGSNERGEHALADLPPPGSGIFEVHASGQAGMLIRRRVLEAIGEPYFETFGKQNEDMIFSAKVREAGFKIYCDVDTYLGHIGTVGVFPHFDEVEGSWGVDLNVGEDAHVLLKRLPHTDSLAPL